MTAAFLLSVVLAITGPIFLLIAGIGIVRLPDLFCRASATTKAATLGVGCLLVAVAVHFGDLGVTTRVLATIAFLLLTAPVAAQMIARAAYSQGVSLWSGTVCDEYRSGLNIHRSGDNPELSAARSMADPMNTRSGR